MDCLVCRSKSCRVNQSCGGEKFSLEQVRDHYHQKATASIVQASVSLVDNGRAGTLSRIQELLEYSKTSGHKKIGLAYCYGMEKLAEHVRNLFLQRDIPCIGISCTCGAMSQKEINSQSFLERVSCNPLSQARQMMEEKVDLAVVIGLCLGHDILFQKEFKRDQTTLIVKDRVYNHNPLEGISQINL